MTQYQKDACGAGLLAREVNQADGEPVFTYFLVGDNENVVALADDNGDVTDRYDYSAFGTVQSHTGSDSNRIMFSSEPNDEDSGLIYLRHRYYEPDSGRFVSKDPTVEYGKNPYLYCDNNAIGLIDPTGKISVLILLGFGALVGVKGDQTKKENTAKIFGNDYIPSYDQIKLQVKYAVSKGAYSANDLNALTNMLAWYYLNYKDLTRISCENAANDTVNVLNTRFNGKNYPFTFIRTRRNQYINDPYRRQNPWNIILIVPKEKAVNISIKPYDSYKSGLHDKNKFNDYLFVLYPGSDPIKPVFFWGEMNHNGDL